MEDGEAGGQPTCLLHTDRHYVLRVELRYGEQETLPLPVENVETMYILCDGHEDGDSELTVQMLEVGGVDCAWNACCANWCCGYK